MMRTIKTIDAHVGGQACRLVVGGVPSLAGITMAHKRRALQRLGDEVRRTILLEPRGHHDLCGAVLTEPVSPGSHAGLLFMDGLGFPAFSGHGVMAAATIAIEKRLIETNDPVLTFDTPAGTVNVRPVRQPRGGVVRVVSVRVTGVPSFVVAPGCRVRLGSRELRVDAAFGGLCHAIVDTESIGVPLDGTHLPELRRLGVEIRDSLNTSLSMAHPLDAAITGVSGVTFTGPAFDPDAHLRSVTVTGDGIANRSPGGSSTAAVMAVLHAMGLLGDDQPFVHEGLAGSVERGQVAQRTQVGDYPAIVPEVDGSAWMTGEHTFVVDEDDPLRDGFRL